MSELSDDERNLLRYYAETERIIHGPVRGGLHQHLLRSGYIEERTVDVRGTLVVVTAAGWPTGRTLLHQGSSGSLGGPVITDRSPHPRPPRHHQRGLVHRRDIFVAALSP